MKFVCPATPYPNNKLGIQVNDPFLSTHQTNCIDKFIDRLVEGEELYRQQSC